MAIIDNQTPVEEMGLEEMLLEIGSQQTALLDYANETTGAGDTRLGDAVRTLADGFGSGGDQDVLEHICDLTVDMSQGTYGSLKGRVPVPLESGVFYLIRPVQGTITPNSSVRNPHAVIVAQNFANLIYFTYSQAFQAASTMELDAATGDFVLRFNSATSKLTAGCQYQLFKVHIYVGEG